MQENREKRIEDRWFTKNARGQLVATSRNGVGKRYRVRYRLKGGRQVSMSFAEFDEAMSWLIAQQHSVRKGSHVDPKDGRISVATWSDEWLSTKVDLKPSTHARYEQILASDVLPFWGGHRLDEVAHSDVQRWVAGLSRRMAPASVRKCHRVLSMLLDMAVRSDRLGKNPAAGVALPRVVAAERRYLSINQVRQLADECAAPPIAKHGPTAEDWNEHYRLVVLFLAFTGCRFGEMAALKVGRINFLRRRALIAESVTVVKGQHVWGTPKGHDRREVPLPGFLVDMLAEHVKGKSASELVFTTAKGGVLRAQGFQRAAMTKAAERIGVPGLHPHELRHTAASLAIASGADVKVVQKMLGHKSATMTLDLYGHLYDDRLDDVADRLGEAFSRASESPLRSNIRIARLRDSAEAATGQ